MSVDSRNGTHALDHLGNGAQALGSEIDHASSWLGRRVLVTGGCSFIGSHLVDALVARGTVSVRVVDDLSTGELANIAEHVADGRVEFVEADLRDEGVARSAVEDIDVVFHLAAIHGGRGYIDLHHSDCAANLALDSAVIQAAAAGGVERFVFASSGCVYPVELQADVTEEVMLREEMVGPPYDPDGMYGWAKLSAELTLRALHRERGFQSVSCRLFTVFGERCQESHAIVAMIARAFLKQRPFDVWGDGRQIRNWTYVADIVSGLILAAERIGDASAVNLGTEDPITVIEAARLVLERSDHDAEIRLLRDMPTGPLNRVASHAMATERLGWRPQVAFSEGLQRTLDWYFETHSANLVEADFERRLIER